MGALDFLENKIEAKVKFPVPKKKKLTENVTLNYQLITFLSQDIVPTIEHLQEKKVLPKNNFYKYLQRVSIMDSDDMFTIYERNQRAKEYKNDYALVVEYFGGLSAQLLSDYQKSNDPFLVDLLYAIIVYEFIMISSPFVVIQNGDVPNKKLLEEIEKEHKSLKSVFDKRFQALSNTKFKHGIYFNLFNKIKYCSQKQFLALVDGQLK